MYPWMSMGTTAMWTVLAKVLWINYQNVSPFCMMYYNLKSKIDIFDTKLEMPAMYA